jgi:hypothetical protein
MEALDTVFQKLPARYRNPAALALLRVIQQSHPSVESWLAIDNMQKSLTEMNLQLQHELSVTA